MAQAVFTKTLQAVIWQLQNLNAAAQLLSSELDVSNALAAMLYLRWAPGATTAADTPPKIEVWASGNPPGEPNTDASHFSPYYVLDTITPDIAAAAVSRTLNGAHGAGAGSLTFNEAETGLTIGEMLLVLGALPEWVRVKSLAANAAALLELTERAHSNTDPVWNRGQQWMRPLDLTAVKRLRFHARNTALAGGTAVATSYIDARLILTESIGS